MKRRWLNVELKHEDETCDRFRKALKANGIRYEASDAGYGFTHFEVFVDDHEQVMLDAILNA